MSDPLSENFTVMKSSSSIISGAIYVPTEPYNANDSGKLHASCQEKVDNNFSKSLALTNPESNFPVAVTAESVLTKTCANPGSRNDGQEVAVFDCEIAEHSEKLSNIAGIFSGTAPLAVKEDLISQVYQKDGRWKNAFSTTSTRDLDSVKSTMYEQAKQTANDAGFGVLCKPPNTCFSAAPSGLTFLDDIKLFTDNFTLLITEHKLTTNAEHYSSISRESLTVVTNDGSTDTEEKLNSCSSDSPDAEVKGTTCNDYGLKFDVKEIKKRKSDEIHMLSRAQAINILQKKGTGTATATKDRSRATRGFIERECVQSRAVMEYLQLREEGQSAMTASNQIATNIYKKEGAGSYKARCIRVWADQFLANGVFAESMQGKHSKTKKTVGQPSELSDLPFTQDRE